MLQEQANRNMGSSQIKSPSDNKDLLIFIPPIHPTAEQSCKDFLCLVCSSGPIPPEECF